MMLTLDLRKVTKRQSGMKISLAGLQIVSPIDRRYAVTCTCSLSGSWCSLADLRGQATSLFKQAFTGLQKSSACTDSKRQMQDHADGTVRDDACHHASRADSSLHEIAPSAGDVIPQSSVDIPHTQLPGLLLLLQLKLKLYS